MDRSPGSSDGMSINSKSSELFSVTESRAEWRSRFKDASDCDCNCELYLETEGFGERSTEEVGEA